MLSQRYRDNCLPRLRAHLTDLRAGAEPLRDIKIVVLGKGRIGKTQICRRLRGESFEADADSTHGIRVSSVVLELAEGEELSPALRAWRPCERQLPSEAALYCPTVKDGG